MLRVLLLIGMLTPVWGAEDRWVYLNSDGFQVFSEAGGRAGRTALVRLEQFRFALGKIVGKAELKIDPPPQVYLFKTAKEADAYGAADPIQIGKEHVSILLSSDTLSEDFERRFARLLLESNTDRMPGDLERGLISLFSTLDVTGIRITVGRPVAAPERNLDWARIHMLTVDPEYYGRLAVLFYNLQKGADDDPAYQNAFGKSKAQVDAEAARYLAAGHFVTATLPSRAMSAEHDFPDKPVEGELMQRKLAGIRGDRETLREYEALLAKARSGKSAVATRALDEAIELEPKRAEPRFLLAQFESDPEKRIELLKVAIALDRRNAGYWQALAEVYTAIPNFKEAAKAWHAAEQAAATPEERDRMRRAWLDVERQRLDFEEAEKKRVAEQNARELQKLKEAEVAKLRALEASVNQGGAPAEKVEAWWTGPTPGGKAEGLLKQFDCIGKQARLTIQTSDGKMTKLAVRDPSHIAISGEKEEAFGCGRQKPRRISVQYVPKADAKLGTVGDVVSIEFPE